MSIRIFGRLGKNIGFSTPFKADPLFWLMVLAAVIVNTCFPRKVHPQTPNLLVQVELMGVGAVMTEAVLTPDSVLLLPARDVAGLLGLEPPPGEWTSVAELQRRFPPIQVAWYPRELRVIIRDDLAVLPATRRLTEQRQRQSQATVYMPTRSGPFLAVAGDDRGRSLIEGGYHWRGKIAVTGQHSSRFGSRWALSVAPSPLLFAALTGGSTQPIAVNLRLTKGPVWVQSAWNAQTQRVQADGLVQVGPVALFASTRDAFALTLNTRPVGFQLGRTGNHTTAKLTYGPLMPSPFSVPVVP
jgi:hypothetical protein